MPLWVKNHRLGLALLTVVMNVYICQLAIAAPPVDGEMSPKLQVLMQEVGNDPYYRNAYGRRAAELWRDDPEGVEAVLLDLCNDASGRRRSEMAMHALAEIASLIPESAASAPTNPGLEKKLVSTLGRTFDQDFLHNSPLLPWRADDVRDYAKFQSYLFKRISSFSLKDPQTARSEMSRNLFRIEANHNQFLAGDAIQAYAKLVQAGHAQGQALPDSRTLVKIFEKFGKVEPLLPLLQLYPPAASVEALQHLNLKEFLKVAPTEEVWRLGEAIASLARQVPVLQIQMPDHLQDALEKFNAGYAFAEKTLVLRAFLLDERPAVLQGWLHLATNADTHPETRQRILHLLQKLDPRDLVFDKALRLRILSDTPGVSAHAIALAVELRRSDESFQELIVSRINHPDLQVQDAAVDALRMIKSSHPEIQHAVAREIEAMAGKWMFKTAATQKRFYTRMQRLILSLDLRDGPVPDFLVQSALVRALTEKNADVAQAAETVLSGFSSLDPTIAARLTKVSQSGRPEAKRLALQVLDSSRKRSIDSPVDEQEWALVEGLLAKAPRVRNTARDALISHHLSDAAELRIGAMLKPRKGIASRIKGPSTQSRAVAAEVLGAHAGTHEYARMQAIKAMQDPELRVRQGAWSRLRDLAIEGSDGIQDYRDAVVPLLGSFLLTASTPGAAPVPSRICRSRCCSRYNPRNTSRSCRIWPIRFGEFRPLPRTWTRAYPRY